MNLSGKIQLADSTFITFFENGEIMRSAKGINTRITLTEAAMYINNAPSYTHASKTYTIDGKYVTFANFKLELEKIEPPEPTIKDEDYRERYIEHTPTHLDPALHTDDVHDEEAEITANEVQTDDEDEDDRVAVVVNPDETGNWWE